VFRAEETRRGELWEEAKAKLATRRKNVFFVDTSGLSCHGIVPRPPAL